ncbi:MAG: hypothetical protein ACI4IE_05050 [Eubacterium sp.]
MKKYVAILIGAITIVLSLVIGLWYNILLISIIGSIVGVFIVNFSIANFKSRIIDLIKALLAGIIVFIIWKFY